MSDVLFYATIERMKKHAIIPIFIPHKGCPNDCVFCNQKAITARQPAVSAKEITNTIETWLSTLSGRPGMETIEIAFFGGSFTGIPMDEQEQYLQIAFAYKEQGRIDKIHLSTRPDYIDRPVLDLLRRFKVNTIELGVQSFDDHVLQASGRGHDSASIYQAAHLIQEYGFELGIQLMIGLPEDSLEKCLYSARETVKLKPSIARLYPTIVIEDTPLMKLYQKGIYHPLTIDEAVSVTKEMYKILTDAHIQIIRVGLKSSDLIREGGSISGSTFHPAFRQLVEGEIAREKMETLLKDTILLIEEDCPQTHLLQKDITFFSSSKWFSCMIGHKGCNKAYFQAKYPGLNIHYNTRTLPDGQIAIAIAGALHPVVK